MRFSLLVLTFLFWSSHAVDLSIVGKPLQKPLDGQICGFGDMDQDRYTDLIVQSQDGSSLTIYSQSEDGLLTRSSFSPIIVKSPPGSAVCAVSDFNGDTLPDILVTSDDMNASGKKISIFMNKEKFFEQIHLEIDPLSQPPTVVDLNGDGIADLVGFFENSTFFCLTFDSSGTGRRCEDISFPGHDVIKRPFDKFPHIFADITGDLSAEIIFALEGDNKKELVFQAWQLEDITDNVGIWKKNDDLIKPIPPIGSSELHFGSGVVADFDGDGRIDILVPKCRKLDCPRVEYIDIFSPEKGWVSLQLDLKDSELVLPKDGTVFRVGDFTLDGYPDLIATVSKGSSRLPVVFENIDYNGNYNFSRKFEMMAPPKNSFFVMPEEMSNGKLVMATFFDLKEDGSLDILVEYNDNKGHLKFDFIHCDDKGDTTFLKVQIFTNVCTKDCRYSKPNDLGSGISWHGACASYTMLDTSGNSQQSSQCQLPQTSQRALHSPFILFGLGRSPNFIDELTLGSPRVPDNSGNQQSLLKQIVPNSRIIVVPPEGDGIHWQSRLYLTPNQLIIQSLAILFSVCVLLILVILVLHYIEHREDVRERQGQLHRFHFDAM